MDGNELADAAPPSTDVGESQARLGARWPRHLLRDRRRIAGWPRGTVLRGALSLLIDTEDVRGGPYQTGDTRGWGGSGRDLSACRCRDGDLLRDDAAGPRGDGAPHRRDASVVSVARLRCGRADSR